MIQLLDSKFQVALVLKTPVIEEKGDMKITVWICTNCHNCYPEKPEKCILAGLVLWPQGVESGCEKYLIVEKTFDFVKVDASWDTFLGLLVALTLADGTEELLVFSGSDAFERRNRTLELAKAS